MSLLTIDHRYELTLEDILAVGDGGRVELASDTAALLDARREQVVAYVEAASEPAYGFNRGFGHNVDLAVDHDPRLLAELQRNLIRSHAMGVGDPCDERIVRITMLLRANSLARGYSGVRSVVVSKIVDLLNAGISPIVPRYGSVSASGDLAPLSHIALAIIGEGDVTVGGKRTTAAKALKQAQITPLELEMKEGLALNNGSQFLTALGIDAADRLHNLLKLATAATALSAQVMLGSATPFRADLHARRPHPGAIKVSAWLRSLLADSPIQEVHRDMEIDGEIQDPYNLRCAGQILGTCIDLVDEAVATFLVEANSVTDNPLCLENDDGQFTDIVSGGHFHGMPVAVKIYNLVQAAAIAARLSNMRCTRFVDPARNKGLGSDLVWQGLDEQQKAVSSGMMMVEYASASLTNWIWGQTMPNHLFSLSTDCGQEDHVSMGAPLAVKLDQINSRFAELLALEFAFCAQAAAIRREQPYFPSKAPISAGARELRAELAETLKSQVVNDEGRQVEVQVRVHKRYPWKESDRRLSPVSERLVAAIQERFPVVQQDRYMAPEISDIAKDIQSGRLLAIVQPTLAETPTR